MRRVVVLGVGTERILRVLDRFAVLLPEDHRVDAEPQCRHNDRCRHEIVRGHVVATARRLLPPGKRRDRLHRARWHQRLRRDVLRYTQLRRVDLSAIVAHRIISLHNRQPVLLYKIRDGRSSGIRGRYFGHHLQVSAHGAAVC